MKKYSVKFFLFFIVFAIYYTVRHKTFFFDSNSVENKNDCGIYGCIDDFIDFEGFDNENGSDKMIVPDIVHFLYLNKTELKFYQVIGIFSVYFNHKPGLIYIHCDNCSFHGKYWEWLKAEPDLWKIIKIHQVPTRNTIFGKKHRWIHHRSDVLRLEVLMNYGGIYLDNDMYIIQSLHKYRYFEMTVGWFNKKKGIGSQVLIAHKNARFLKAHFDSYREKYSPHRWYWNAGVVPAEYLKTYGYLVHIVHEKLGTHNIFARLYRKYWTEWKAFDSVHLLINHRSYLDKDSPIKEFDEFNIINYNFTYGFMARDILRKMKRIN